MLVQVFLACITNMKDKKEVEVDVLIEYLDSLTKFMKKYKYTTVSRAMLMDNLKRVKKYRKTITFI